MRLYEAMILIETGKAKDDLEGLCQGIRKNLERFGAEVINCEKWDERRLAYPIKHQRRGTYVLSHFNAPPDAVSKIERAFRLSDSILRALITLDEDGSEIVPPGTDREDATGGRGDYGGRSGRY